VSLHTLTLRELAAGLRARKFSSQELTAHFLKRIEAHDKQLNSFVTVCAESARAAAAAADALLAQGDAGPLTGIPLAQKDIFCTQGVKTSCGSRMLDRFIAPSTRPSWRG
jgi:aspartyl-tRNA(Asn)/glutamyl-tRNA(Gln) amidotransferase subunit A